MLKRDLRRQKKIIKKRKREKMVRADHRLAKIEIRFIIITHFLRYNYNLWEQAGWKGWREGGRGEG